MHAVDTRPFSSVGRGLGTRLLVAVDMVRVSDHPLLCATLKAEMINIGSVGTA